MAQTSSDNSLLSSEADREQAQELAMIADWPNSDATWAKTCPEVIYWTTEWMVLIVPNLLALFSSHHFLVLLRALIWPFVNVKIQCVSVRSFPSEPPICYGGDSVREM
jgi:hypothetical protein